MYSFRAVPRKTNSEIATGNFYYRRNPEGLYIYEQDAHALVPIEERVQDSRGHISAKIPRGELRPEHLGQRTTRHSVATTRIVP
jgi:hypothetical protein